MERAGLLGTSAAEERMGLLRKTEEERDARYISYLAEVRKGSWGRVGGGGNGEG